MLGTGRPEHAELVSCFWMRLFVWDPKNISGGDNTQPLTWAYWPLGVQT